jgi:chemotaxis protein methyltransferase CheR
VRQIGLRFDDTKLNFLDDLLQRRLKKVGRADDVYLRELECKPSEGELAALARELTVGETYFFRNIEQFRALAEVVLPERMSARRASSTLRLLSAGCASGEEPYSIAIVTKETVTDPSWTVEIDAVDINPVSLQAARRAHYSAWALRGTSMELQKKWFRVNGRDMVLDKSVCDAVRFSADNLAGDNPKLWRTDCYDAIFCRNVLMYFSPEQMRAAIARIACSLAPGGFLFLGHAETLHGASEAFHLRQSHGTFYYTLRGGREGAERAVARVATQGLPAAAPALTLDQTWFDAIGKATLRIAALVPGEPAPIAPAAQTSTAWDLMPALDLLRQERFADALLYIRTRPDAADGDTDVLLTEAMLLVHAGQFAAAEDAGLQLLLVDEFNAGAHYVLALCHEHAGRPGRALEHDRIATRLDPGFAMPRLHLGLLAGRAGDRSAAYNELVQALCLLEREEASRLQLFGGGFSRETLMTLCQSALRENGTDG